MQNWLPFSQKPQAKVPINYNAFFTPNSTGFYEKGGTVHVKNDFQLVNANPLVSARTVDYPFAYSALQYGFGKGVRNPPDNVTPAKGRYSIQQVRDLDASNYYNFIK